VKNVYEGRLELAAGPSTTLPTSGQLRSGR
jgi:hypothetical protein